MKRTAYLSIFLVLAVMLSLPAQATPVGKITFVLGRVDITVGSQPAKPAYKGDDVNVGDILRTKSKSKAEVTFVDGSILRLAQNSRIRINEYMVKKDQTVGTLQLFRGKVQSIVSTLAGLFGNKKQNRYEVRTPTAVCGVRGTDFFTWYINGESGAAFKKGKGYIFPSNAPRQIRNVNTGQAAMVKTAGTPPVIAPATDVEIQQHISDTAPTEETPSDEGATPEAPPAPPSGAGGPPPTESTVADTSIFNIYTNPFTFTEFAGDVGLGFLSDGLFSGAINEQDGEGLVALTGLVSSYGGGAQAGTIGGITLDSEGGFGAFDGYLSGVAGSYNALFSSIFIDSGKGVRYLYGALSSGADLAEGETLSAGGTALMTEPLGTASHIVPDPETEQTLPEALAAAMQDYGYPVPAIGGIDLDTGAIDTGSSSAQQGIELNPYPDVPGRRLNVWNFTSNGGSFSNAGRKASADFIYGQAGGDFYTLGNINVLDNLAGLVSVSGRLTYIDETHMGDINLWNRGRYDAEGVFNNAGAGLATMDPLAYSGYWGSAGGLAGESLMMTMGSIYADDLGSFNKVGNDDGLFGGQTAPWKAATASLMALGEYSAMGGAIVGRNLWNTPVFGLDPFFFVDIGGRSGRVPVFFGSTGGWWEAPDGSAYGTMAGAAVAVYMDPDPDAATYGQAGWLVSGDISGSIISNLPIPMWQATGNWNRTVKQTVTNPLDYDIYTGSFSDVRLAGSFSESGEIWGWGDEGGGTLFWYDSGAEADLTSLPWGAYDLKLGYYNTYMDKSGDAWSAVAGGMADFDYVPSSEGGDYGFWIAQAGGTWTADGKISGSLGELGNPGRGAYISPYTSGTLGGNFQGISEDETWIGQSLGRFEGARNKFFSYLYADVSHAEVYSYYPPTDPVFDYESNNYVNEVYEDFMNGYLGGTSSLWTGSDIPVTVMGNIGGLDSVWAGEIVSNNYISWTQTTYDGGAYKGFIGGIKLDNLLSGGMVALYIDPNQNAGYLLMDLDGAVYPDIGMFEMAGTANRHPMETGFSVSPENLGGNLDEDYFSIFGYGGFASGGGNIYSGYYDSSGGGDVSAIEFIDTGWGVWSFKQYGGYDKGGESNDWIMYLADSPDDETWVLAGDLGGRIGGQWSSDRIKGDVAGAWIDIGQAVTGVLGGELAGTFNAVNATWESVAAGGFIETGRFLDMIQNNPAALQALNIPYAEVGRADLTGSVDIGYGTQQVNMYDTTFFAYSTGAKPRIWASGEVTGTNPTGFSYYTVPISGASGNTSVSADFYMQQYNSSPGGSWNATVNGIGTVGGVADTPFKGAAAGTVGAGTDSRDISYDFSGTAAGVVNAPNPPSP